MMTSNYAFSVVVVIALLAGCSGDDKDNAQSAPSAPDAVEKVPPTVAEFPVKEKIEPPEPAGAHVYRHYCADCHDAGEGHPGTMRLAERLGEAQSVLLSRGDLTPDYVKIIVRNGFQMMPPFRPSEIDNEALESLAAYIASSDPGSDTSGSE